VGVKKNNNKKKPSNTHINQKLQWKKKHNLSLSLSLSLFTTQLLFCVNVGRSFAPSESSVFLSFLGEISPNFVLKNMISTYAKDFS
jgi:hypothetical protein